MTDYLATKGPHGVSITFERGSSILTYASAGLFILVAGTLGGLILLNKAQSEAHASLLTEVSEKEEDLRGDILSQIFLLEAQLKGLRTVLSSHTLPSNIIRFVERNTLSQVQFLTFGFDAASRKLEMLGEAASYSVLAQQINVFERDPSVERVEFGGLSITGANHAGFSLKLTFKPTLLTLRQQ